MENNKIIEVGELNVIDNDLGITYFNPKQIKAVFESCIKPMIAQNRIRQENFLTILIGLTSVDTFITDYADRVKFLKSGRSTFILHRIDSLEKQIEILKLTNFDLQAKDDERPQVQARREICKNEITIAKLEEEINMLKLSGDYKSLMYNPSSREFAAMKSFYLDRTIEIIFNSLHSMGLTVLASSKLEIKEELEDIFSGDLLSD